MNGDAKKQAIYTALQKLAEKGRLSPAEVVKVAKDPKSPLHEMFEWDDSVAAAHYRLDQARGLIRTVEVHFEKHTYTLSAPAYIRDPAADPREQGYVSTVALSSDKDRARAALVNEAGRAAAQLQRVRDLSVALELEDEVDVILAQFTEFSRALGV